MDTSKNKKIIVTGVTRGLGKALLERFAENGHIVAGCGRSQSDIEKLRKHYQKCIFHVVDVSNLDAVMNWADEINQQIGAPDLLINNASIMNHPAHLWEIPAKEFDDLIQINVIGSWNIIKAFVPKMIATKSGTIINMSSGWGHYGSALFGPYCTSKFAIEGMTQSLAQELPAGMAAIALSPGVIDTDMLKMCSPETARLAPSPEEWSKIAAPFILHLGPDQNGKSLEVPTQ